MRKKRISNPSRSSRKSNDLSAHEHRLRFIGISLSGGKSDRTCLAVIEYYPARDRLFLAHLEEKIKSDENSNSDVKLANLVKKYREDCVNVEFDSPLTLPKCVRCELKCPGYDLCSETEIIWYRKVQEKLAKKRPRRFFTPYSQRCVEAYLIVNNNTINENIDRFEIQNAMGSNLAPLFARGDFLSRQFGIPCYETMTKIAVWRIGLHLKLGKNILRKWWNAVGGDACRGEIMKALSQQTGLFLYQQDLKTIIENNHAFEAVISAYVGYLRGKNQTEDRPEGFPETETWIDIPKF